VNNLNAYTPQFKDQAGFAISKLYVVFFTIDLTSSCGKAIVDAVLWGIRLPVQIAPWALAFARLQNL
jgi:hypothetical protein